MWSLYCLIIIIKVFTKMNFPIILCHTTLKFLSASEAATPDLLQISLPFASAPLPQIYIFLHLWITQSHLSVVKASSSFKNLNTCSYYAHVHRSHLYKWSTPSRYLCTAVLNITLNNITLVTLNKSLYSATLLLLGWCPQCSSI